jgi:hypothetical protein
VCGICATGRTARCNLGRLTFRATPHPLLLRTGVSQSPHVVWATALLGFSPDHRLAHLEMQRDEVGEEQAYHRSLVEPGPADHPRATRAQKRGLRRAKWVDMISDALYG